MWISFLNLIVLLTFNMAKPEDGRTTTGHSVYDHMSSIELDTVTDIIERICDEHDWDFSTIYWDLTITQEND